MPWAAASNVDGSAMWVTKKMNVLIRQRDKERKLEVKARQKR